ncbi:ferredoxin Fer [Haloarchaeobius sp. DFWS5]|uniref:ferredoxin Fer n=1 Tax=Haloarchaeobius sp. DFWS5 TaxID=3446114 RepID=UPI003EBDB459
MESPYDVLGVDPDADDDEIERAFRQRVKTAHPDQGGSVREFQLVMTAYDELTAEESSDWTDTASGDATASPDGEVVVDDTPEKAVSRVEYLNYEILSDHGWDLGHDDLFRKARRARLDEEDHGEFFVESGDTLLEAAEENDLSWPFSCRGGACANCAVRVMEGELEIFVDHVLPEELTDEGIHLSCIGTPITRELKVLYNVKHLPSLEELWLPPRQG